MKQVLLSFLLLSLVSVVQAQSGFSGPDTEYSCERLTYDRYNDLVILQGNVDFSNTELKIEQADLIIYNQKTNELTAYSPSICHYKESVVYERQEGEEEQILKTKLGSGEFSVDPKEEFDTKL